ncbi:MAG: hypothetical protein J6S67_05810 [Methanobrevibacter sp.]|nr:hypothetical protein [Methanobrevibacter sp.]
MRLNIQLFAGGTIPGSSTTSNGKVQVVWSSTPSDAVTNQSSVYAYVQVARTFTGDATRGTFSGTITINGTATSVSKKITMSNKNWYTIGEVTINVPHNEDGTKTCNISARLTQSGTSLAGTYTASQDVTLDTIARASAFNSFSMSVNNDASISVYANITKRNSGFTDILSICNENITLNDGDNYITFSNNEHSTAKSTFYQIMGNETQANYTAILTTQSSGVQIGNQSSITAYNVALPNYSISIGTITSSDNNSGVATTNYSGGTTHYVSEFTTTNTFLQGWSNPKLSYSLDATHHTLYGNTIDITGDIDDNNLDLGNHTYNLGTGFTGGTKTLNVSDGRKSTSGNITLTRKDWATPSVSITLTRESATGTQINWEVSWSYTNVSGGITPKLNASYTYNGTTTALISDRTLTSTSGTLSGSFNLSNADDYKYPIDAGARLEDMIDYRVASNFHTPGGLPAIYVHKDANANNEVDIYGKETINGSLVVANSGKYVLIGPQNSSYCHYITDAPTHWFNTSVDINGELIMAYNTIIRATDGLYVGGIGNYIVFRPNGMWNSANQMVLRTTGLLEAPALYIYDTRNDNLTPQQAMETFGSGHTRTEFKSYDMIGMPKNYGQWFWAVETISPWGDSSGGLPIQIAYQSNNYVPLIMARAGTSNSTWSAWQGVNFTKEITFNGQWLYCSKASGMGARMIIPYNNPYKQLPNVNITSCQYFDGSSWVSCSVGLADYFETFLTLNFSGIGNTPNDNVLISMYGSITF